MFKKRIYNIGKIFKNDISKSQINVLLLLLLSLLMHLIFSLLTRKMKNFFHYQQIIKTFIWKAF